MISCAIFGRMYGPSRGIESFQEIHTQVTDRIPLIYTEILDFSFEVKKHMKKSKLRKLIDLRCSPIAIHRYELDASRSDRERAYCFVFRRVWREDSSHQGP